MNGFWITVAGMSAGLALVALANHRVSVSRLIAAWRLARFMSKMKLGMEPLAGYVAVNGNLGNALVMSTTAEDGEVTPGHVPMWIHESAGEAFLKELQELRITGAPTNGRLVPVVAFEILEVIEEDGDGSEENHG